MSKEFGQYIYSIWASGEEVNNKVSLNLVYCYKLLPFIMGGYIAKSGLLQTARMLIIIILLTIFNVETM